MVMKVKSKCAGFRKFWFLVRRRRNLEYKAYHWAAANTIFTSRYSRGVWTYPFSTLRGLLHCPSLNACSFRILCLLFSCFHPPCFLSPPQGQAHSTSSKKPALQRAEWSASSPCACHTLYLHSVAGGWQPGLGSRTVCAQSQPRRWSAVWSWPCCFTFVSQFPHLQNEGKNSTTSWECLSLRRVNGRSALGQDLTWQQAWFCHSPSTLPTLHRGYLFTCSARFKNKDCCNSVRQIKCSFFHLFIDFPGLPHELATSTPPALGEEAL